MTKIRCKRYPMCDDIHPLSEVENHEKNDCKYLPCKQCGRNLKTDIETKISMQAHLQLHCEEKMMPCQFCSIELPRRELNESHECHNIHPKN